MLFITDGEFLRTVSQKRNQYLARKLYESGAVTRIHIEFVHDRYEIVGTVFVNDTIYTCRYANQSLSTRYLFDFGSMKPPYSILGNSMAFEQKERSYAFIKDVTESPIHIFLYLQVGGKDVRFIKEKKNSKTYLLAENGLSFWPYWYSDGCLIGFYSIQHINGRSIKDGRLKNVVEGMKADSNPILSIIK